MAQRLPPTGRLDILSEVPWFSRRPSRPLASIDLGTAYIRVGTPTDPVRVERPTRATRVMREAMRGGVVNDVDAAADVLAAAVTDAGVARCRVVVSAPATITPLERTALLSALRLAGLARAPVLIEEPLAAAIGLGLDIADDEPHLVVDIGHGISEAAVIAAGSIRSVAATRVGCAQLLDPFAGGDAGRRAESALAAVTATVRAALDDVPADMAAAVDKVHLVGGGSLVADVATHLAAATGLAVEVSRDPLHMVARGDAACAALPQRWS